MFLPVQWIGLKNIFISQDHWSLRWLLSIYIRSLFSSPQYNWVMIFSEAYWRKIICTIICLICEYLKCRFNFNFFKFKMVVNFYALLLGLWLSFCVRNIFNLFRLYSSFAMHFEYSIWFSILWWWFWLSVLLFSCNLWLFQFSKCQINLGATSLSVSSLHSVLSFFLS